MAANAALTRVKAWAMEADGGTSPEWTLRVCAICAYGLPGLERVVTSREVDSSTNGAAAFCPGSKRMLGTGFEVVPSGFGDVLIDTIAVSPEEIGVGVGAFEDEDGMAGGWSVDAHAICADPGRWARGCVGRYAEHSDVKVWWVSCPGEKRMVGAGADIVGGNGEVVLDELTPNPELTTVTAAAFEDANDYDWS